MRKLAVAVLLSVSVLIANAQSQPKVFQIEKTVTCSSLKIIIEAVTGEQYQEEPFWNGGDSDSKYIMTVKQKDKNLDIDTI